MKKKRSSFKEFLIYLLAGTTMEITRLAPRRLSYAFWYFMSLLLWPFPRNRRRIARENLRAVYPDISEEKIDSIAFRAFANACWLYAEFSWMGELNRNTVDRFVSFEGWENLEKAYKKGKGVILPTMHLYNGELVTAAVAARGMPVHWVIREVDNRYLDEKMDRIRLKTGLSLIKKEKALRSMIKVLSDGRILGLTTDQKASLNGIWVKFLGLWSSTVKSPAVFHLRTGAPIVPIFSYPMPDRTHKAYILPEIEYTPTGNSKRDVFTITQMIADLQSEFIYRHPEIWLWFHRRWSLTPSEKDIAEAQKLADEALQAGFKADTSLIR